MEAFCGELVFFGQACKLPPAPNEYKSFGSFVSAIFFHQSCLVVVSERNVSICRKLNGFDIDLPLSGRYGSRLLILFGQTWPAVPKVQSTIFAGDTNGMFPCCNAHSLCAESMEHKHLSSGFWIPKSSGAVFAD